MALSGILNEEVESDQNIKQEKEAEANKGTILSEEELHKIAGGSTPEDSEIKESALK